VFRESYAKALEAARRGDSWKSRRGPLPLDPESTYVQEPPYFAGFSAEPAKVGDLIGARILAVLGDSVTTDHISPAGSIAADSQQAAICSNTVSGPPIQHLWS